jgi:glycosyltransferase involved in cell wall biosynthesis
LKLLIVSSQYPPRPSPESAHTLLLCEQLAARGVEVDLLTSELLPGFPAPKGFQLHPRMKSWNWSQFPNLLFSIRRLRPDAVLLIYIDWIYGCHPMITFAPAILRWLHPRTRFVTQFENVSGASGIISPDGTKSRFAKWFASLLAGRRGLHPTYGSLLRDSSHIIALSEKHAEAFAIAHPGVSSKIRVIPAAPATRFASEEKPGSARQRGRMLLGLSEQDLVLAYFGYVYLMKGVETLLAAFGSLPPDTRLVIIGSSGDIGYLEKLHELSRSAGGAERVIWAGHCKPEVEFASLYLHAADICVLPFNDGVWLNNSSFAVAASHGLPIVTTRGKSLEAPLLDGENVRLCPPNDSVALAATIAELIRSPETRKRLATGARKLAENCFSWDRVIESTLKVLNAPFTGQSK